MIKNILKIGLSVFVLTFTFLYIFEDSTGNVSSEGGRSASNDERAGDPEAGKNNSDRFKFGDAGYYIINGERVDPIDLLGSDPVDIGRTQNVEFYGYIGIFTERDRTNVRRGFHFDTDLDPGTPRGNRVGMNTALRLPAIFSGSLHSEGGSVDTWPTERGEAFRFLTQARNMSAAVRVKGELQLFSNTLNLYFRAQEFEILQLEP